MDLYQNVFFFVKYGKSHHYHHFFQTTQYFNTFTFFDWFFTKTLVVLCQNLTRLRNWFGSNLDDLPSEAWQDSDSNDLMRWAEECRAHTESLPTPISRQIRQIINKTEPLSAVSPPPYTHTHCSPFFHKNQADLLIWLTHSDHISTDLQWLYSGPPDCSAPWKSSGPAEGHWPQMAVDDKAHSIRELIFTLWNKSPVLCSWELPFVHC